MRRAVQAAAAVATGDVVAGEALGGFAPGDSRPVLLASTAEGACG